MEEQKQTTENASPEDITFYNVMPKTKDGAMVMPTIKTSVTEKPSPPASEENQSQVTSDLTAKKTLPRRYKIYAVVFAVIVGLTAAGYFLIPKFFFSDYQPENLLAKPSSSNKQQGANLKTDWTIKYFGSVSCDKNICGDDADADHDGLINLKEYQLKTDPNNADSDKDGLADGDEVNIFSSDPLNDHSGVNKQYTDGDYIKNGYDLTIDKALSIQQITSLHDKMKQFGLHQPSVTTLSDQLLKLYKFDQTTATSSPASTATTSPSSTQTASSTQGSLPKNLDMSPEAKQDRDTQRSLIIKNIGIALIKYNDDNHSYPPGNDFKQMYTAIKPYLKTATNPNDPINIDPYIYTYAAKPDKSDFSLTYYSETLNQLIKKTAKDAQADKNQTQSEAFDDQRRTDTDSLRSALLIYSADNVAGNQNYVFPSKDKYKTALVPKYLTAIPKDPKTQTDYAYEVSDTFDTFTLKAIYDAAPAGKTGYLCNQEECHDY